MANMFEVTGDKFYDGAYTVIEKENLNYFDPKANSNKFYVAEVHESKAGLGYRLYVNYGRNGASGSVKVQPFSNLNAAMSEFRSKVSSKKRKGYIAVEMATSDRGSSEGQKLVNEAGVAGVVDLKKTQKAVKSKLPKEVQGLITRIYAEANQAVSLSLSGSAKSEISTPLGNLGINGINSSRDILKELQYNVANGNNAAVERLSIEYFRRTPRTMSIADQKDGKWLLYTQDRIQKELDTLDLYEDTLRLLPIMGSSDIDVKYKGLACDLTIPTADEMAYIKHKVESTVANNHHYKLQVVGAWGVNQHNAPAFDDSCGNVRHLFHGSRSANIVGILSSYLKLPNDLTGVVKTGAMFGPGIYTASNSSKSFNYSSGTWCGRANKYDTAYLFICQVAMGNVYKVNSATYFTKPPAGYDSVMGCRGANLLNDEFIVYKANQVRIKYLVECKKIR